LCSEPKSAEVIKIVALPLPFSTPLPSSSPSFSFFLLHRSPVVLLQTNLSYFLYSRSSLFFGLTSLERTPPLIKEELSIIADYNRVDSSIDLCLFDDLFSSLYPKK
jgi:hypothetical protein